MKPIVFLISWRQEVHFQWHEEWSSKAHQKHQHNQKSLMNYGLQWLTLKMMVLGISRESIWTILVEDLVKRKVWCWNVLLIHQIWLLQISCCFLSSSQPSKGCTLKTFNMLPMNWMTFLLKKFKEAFKGSCCHCEYCIAVGDSYFEGCHMHVIISFYCTLYIVHLVAKTVKYFTSFCY